MPLFTEAPARYPAGWAPAPVVAAMSATGWVPEDRDENGETPLIQSPATRRALAGQLPAKEIGR